jgi:hypothetical protein
VAHFRESFDLTDSSGLWAHPVAESQLQLLPEAESVELEPFASAPGLICMDNVQAPNLFRTTYKIKPPPPAE